MKMLIRRLFSAAILISIVALVVRLGGFFFFAAVLVVAGLAGYEFYRMMEKGGYKPSYAVVIGLIIVLLFDARLPSFAFNQARFGGHLHPLAFFATF